ncbi:MAG TPA: IclR family transcriptional regulator C-terminal domain-containing protein [Nakamurella sp.]|jgi:DNA-binding IclR family transcriptional regulator
MVAADPAAGASSPSSSPTSVLSRRAAPPDLGNGAVTLTKALSIVEFVAEREGASAREIAVGIGIPLSTAYRLAHILVAADYLVHLKEERRFALGIKLRILSQSVDRQFGLSPEIRAAVGMLHRQVGAAAYFAQYRGSEVVVAHVEDSPECPRVTPLDVGMHEATHATAFGKVLLAGMLPEQLDHYLSAHPMRRLTPATMTGRAELENDLAIANRTGVAWEYEEFMPDLICVAAGVRGGNGMILGSVALSGPAARMRRSAPACEEAVRRTAARVSRCLRAYAQARP